MVIHVSKISEPHQMDQDGDQVKNKAIGIDLGTTNCVVGWIENDGVEILKDEQARSCIPSFVYYGQDITVGHQAHEDFQRHGKGAVRSVKRLMGKGVEDVERIAGHQPYDLLPSQKDQDHQMIRLKIGDHICTPIEVCADLLRFLKEKVKNRWDQDVHDAVITVPAYFDEGARQATKDAAQLAGLNVLRLISEPTAAALAYGLDQGEEGFYAVYDLGGGTFDISILYLRQGVFQVKATVGDANFGGDDFDRCLVEKLMDCNGSLSSDEITSMMLVARKMKEELTHQKTAKGIFEWSGGKKEVCITQDEFHQLIHPFVSRTLDLMTQALDDAKISIDQVKGVILVGGSTRVPLVTSGVSDFFSQRVFDHLNVDEVVAMGAAKQAHALSQGGDHILLDVLPLSLGLETMGELVEKVIDRNTPIPAIKAQEFTTYQDGQTAMVIHVLQGEREMVADCRSLGRFTLSGIPPLAAGQAKVRVEFQVDADGLLTVSAQETMTGVHQSIEVKPSYGLTQEDMLEMLRQSQIHGKDDLEKRFLKTTSLKSEDVLTRLEKALDEDGNILNYQERQDLQQAMEKVKKCLCHTDRHALESATQDLEEKASSFIQRRVTKVLSASLKGQSVETFD